MSYIFTIPFTANRRQGGQLHPNPSLVICRKVNERDGRGEFFIMNKAPWT